MLAPNVRLSTYDFLKPPPGWSVDALLACTYSAALDTVLSFPAAIHSESGDMALPGSFTAADLAALKRICGSTLIFCQRGAIHPAEMITPAVIEVEPMIHEVEVPAGPDGKPPTGAFHPKLWLIRFTEADRGRSMLRLAVLSRNLTADRSWDLGVVLESRAAGTRASCDPGGIGVLLRALPGLCTRKLTLSQHRIVTKLAEDAERARWQMPDGLRAMRIHTLGIGGRKWLQPPSDRMIVLSPFLTTGAIDRLARECAEPVALISRRDALDRVWPAASGTFSSCKVLAPPADPAWPEGSANLHGKAILWERGRRRNLALGSMNATSAAIGGANVEVMVSFDCTAALGEAGLDGLFSMAALGTVIEDYEPSDPGAVPVAPFDDRPARAALFRTRPWLDCERREDGWALALRCENADPALAAQLPGLRFRPATLPGASSAPCFPGLIGSDKAASFPQRLELAQITGFVVFEAGAADAATAFTLNLEVRGVSEEERRVAAMRALLPTERSFVDFMRMLLGGFAPHETSPGGASGADGSPAARPTGLGPGLLELLLRCAADDPQRLQEIEKTLQALDLDEMSGIAPEAFRAIWTALSAITGARR
jgi:hypothetical protein